MASLSIQTIAIEALRRGGWSERISATSGSTSTFIDTNLLKDTGASSYAYDNNYAWIISAVNNSIVNLYRRIASFSPVSGTVTLGNPLPAAISSGDQIEISGINPRLVKDCIITALRRTTFVREDSVSWTTGQNKLDISGTLPWVTTPEQVLRIRYRTTNTGVANQYYYEDFAPYEWAVEMNAGVPYIEFDDALRSTDPNVVLLIQTVAPHITDTVGVEDYAFTQTVNIPLDWIVPLTTVELINRIGKNADLLQRGTFRLDLLTEVRAADAAAALFAPSLNYNVRIKS